MNIVGSISAALLVSVSLAGTAMADEGRNTAKHKVPASTQIMRTQLVGSVRSAETPVRPAEKRCDTLLCPMYLVLGSGY